jgi:hypothetical protein
MISGSPRNATWVKVLRSSGRMNHMGGPPVEGQIEALVAHGEA